MKRYPSGARAGGLEQRVKIEQPARGQDDRGEVTVEAWQHVATVWAEIMPVSGREALLSGEYRAGISTRIRIRWLDGLDASMRVLHGETVYGIDAVLPRTEGRKEIWLMCTDGVVTEGGQP